MSSTATANNSHGAEEEEYYEDEEYYEQGADEEGGGDDYKGDEGTTDDQELENIKKRVQEMEKETDDLTRMRSQVESQIGSTAESLDKCSV